YTNTQVLVLGGASVLSSANLSSQLVVSRLGLLSRTRLRSLSRALAWLDKRFNDCAERHLCLSAFFPFQETCHEFFN
ncbi:MAG: hypothetical protein ACK49R_12560, partial [Planctomycetota bacterium]